MNATKLFALTVLTAVAGAAFASGSNALDVTSGLQRAQVKADVMRAMRDGTLMRTGEAWGYVVPPSTSTLSREAVKAEVARARIDGTLMGAGETASWPGSLIQDTPSTLARADVKAQVLQARRDGTLIPPGESYGSDTPGFGGTPIAVRQARIGR